MKSPRGTVLLAGLLLSACSSEASKAEQELSILENASASGDELCAAKRKVADAYLREGDEENFARTKEYADTTCLRSEIDQDYARFGDEADNVANMADLLVDAIGN